MSGSVSTNVSRDDRPAHAGGSPAVPRAVDALVDRLADELAVAWRAGNCRPVESYLAAHPQLRDHPEAALRLVYEEICLRQELGRPSTATEILARFPQWSDQLKILLECHQLFEPAPQKPDFPEVGASLNDFQLVAELGRGALGRVFLATQPVLADRPVVLKLTPCIGGEHLSLARLQHAGIVPIYFVHDDPERNLRTLGMPYFGGLTLAHLLDELRTTPMEKRTGEHLVRALEKTPTPVPLALPARGGPRTYLAKWTYVESVCWIGACLAEALQYAHDRGLIHLDIKPSNVLLAADGQPMLLDFHLAQPCIHPTMTRLERIGGTLAYMPREQQAAMAAVNRGQPIPEVVDGRADIYSLGVLLYEALGGRIPVLPGASPSLFRINPQVSRGLSDLVDKCLGLRACDRYPSAAALAGDLGRHLRNQPLRGVANRSWAERWRKWRKRKPHALGYAAGALGLLGVALVAVFLGLQYTAEQQQRLKDQQLHAASQRGKARSDLETGKTWLVNKDYARAEADLDRGLREIREMPDAGDLRRRLEEQRRLAALLKLAQDLHSQVEDKIRYQFVGSDRLSSRANQNLKDDCHLLWKNRALLLTNLGREPPGETPASVRDDLRSAAGNVRLDLFDVAVIWSDLELRLAEGPAVPLACRESLQVIAEAEQLFGPSPALERERLIRAEKLGDGDQARRTAERLQDLKPRTAWEHFLLGRTLLRAQKLAEAETALREAVDRDPHAFWPQYYRAVCAYQRHQYEDAVAFFSVCIALEKRRPAVCYFNRALAHRELKHAGEALRDLEHALKEGFDPAEAHYQMALAHRDLRKDRTAARKHLQQALKHNPEHKPAKEMLLQLEH
jgi:serine/threonine protein kinase/Tfp pilus assembly protein PilF